MLGLAVVCGLISFLMATVQFAPLSRRSLWALMRRSYFPLQPYWIVAAAIAAAAAHAHRTLGVVAAAGCLAILIASELLLRTVAAAQGRAEAIAELNVERSRLLGEALTVEERERERLAAYLHDEPLQLLVAAQQELDEARRGEAAALERASSHVSAAVSDLRRTLVHVPPLPLEEVGLGVVLPAVARQLCRGRFDLRVSIDPAARVMDDGLVYSLARELITNVVKHSSAQRVEVAVGTPGGRVVLEVADDGVGFDPAAGPEDGHVGLALASHRARAAGGELAVESAPGRGTRVRVSLPQTPRSAGIVASSVPLTARGAHGELAPVDLGLVPRDGALEPKLGVSEVRIGRRLGDGIAVAGTGVRVVAAAGAAGDPAELRQGRAVWPNALRDTDVVATALPAGAGVAYQLRSPDSPQAIRMPLDVPPGATLQAAADGGLDVRDDGWTVARISAPVAVGADGAPVPARLVVDGPGQVSLAVAHREADAAYPVLVDPEITNAPVNGTQTWSFTSYPAGKVSGNWDGERVDAALAQLRRRRRDDGHLEQLADDGAREQLRLRGAGDRVGHPARHVQRVLHLEWGGDGRLDRQPLRRGDRGQREHDGAPVRNRTDDGRLVRGLLGNGRPRVLDDGDGNPVPVLGQ